MPIKVKTHRGDIYILGPKAEGVVTEDKVTFAWSGDDTNNLRVTEDDQSLGNFDLPLPGTTTEVKYTINIPPIEKGEQATPVSRTASIERF